jgi:hypothetical protein
MDRKPGAGTSERQTEKRRETGSPNTGTRTQTNPKSLVTGVLSVAHQRFGLSPMGVGEISD